MVARGLQGWLQVFASDLNEKRPPSSNSCVCHCDWWCLALRMFPIDLSPSQSGWWCPALRMSPIRLSFLMAIHLSPIVAGRVRLSGYLQFIRLPLKQFICLPVWLVESGFLHVSKSFVSPIAIHLSPSLAGGVRLSGCFHFISLPF